MANAEALESGESSQGTTDHGRTGKYTILMELGSGGSATVSAAISKGIAGFSKVVVLKTIRDGLGEDEATIKMFLGEARLSARMNHPNVVQVYEVYKQNKLPVIVMEYLDGQSFATVLSRAWGKQNFSRELGIAILAKTLAGLHYAHSLTDYSGEPLHLVHRDVSPHNVMISYDGQVKLVDFGIAKLKNQGAKTRTGVIKGKLNYMAPEQVHGDIDHRADIFAVGVMLWEILAGRRFWGDAGDATIIGRLLRGQLADLREASPDLDLELQRITSKALAIDVEHRYASAAEMQADLEAYLDQSAVDVSQAAISGLLERTCSDLREKTKAALQQKVMALGMSATSDIDPNEGNEVLHSIVVRSRPEPRRRLWLAGLGSAAAVLLVVAAVSRRAPTSANPGSAPPVVAASAPPAPPSGSPSGPGRVQLRVSVIPQDAQLYLDDRRLSSNPFRDSLPGDDVDHTFRAEASGFEPFEKVVRMAADLDITISLQPIKPQPRPPSGSAPRARARPTSPPRLEAAAPVPPVEPAPGAAPPPPAPAPLPEVRAKPAAPGEDLRNTRDDGRRRVEFDDPYTKK